MNGAAAAILLALFAMEAQAPDLQVEAVSTTGAAVPELADAVARALVAGGNRVVLHGPSSGPCSYCTRIRITETAPWVCRVDVHRDQHLASTTLKLPVSSPLFDRARAIAIQARLLMALPGEPDSKPTTRVARAPAGTGTRTPNEGKRPVVSPVAPAKAASSTAAPDKIESTPYLATAHEASTLREPIPASQPLIASSQKALAASPTVTYTSLIDGNPVIRPAGKTTAEAKPARLASAQVADRPAGETRSTVRLPKQAPAAAGPPGPGGVQAAIVSQASPAASKSRWPWIPTALGAGAAAGAGICALVARGHYDALSDRNQSYGSALAEKSAGENWQTASLLLSGVAVAGVGVGIVGFVMRSRSQPSIVGAAVPVPGGALVALSGEIP